MNLKQLRDLAQGKRTAARQKAVEAQIALEGETPDIEASTALLDESKALAVNADDLTSRADLMQEAQTLAKEPEPTPEPKAKHVTPLVVTTDEADNALKANPYKSFGELLMSVKNAALGVPDKRLLPLRSRDAADEGGYSLNGALGDDFVGGLTKSAFRKQTGLNEGLGSEGGFMVGTDQGGSLMERVYSVGDILQRVDMTGISANSNGMTFWGVDETSRANGSRRGGIRAYWAAEGGTKTPSQPSYRKLELRLRKVIGLVYATDELLMDASALESWIMTNLPEELRFVTEDAIVNGPGGGVPQGVRASGALVTQDAEGAQAADTIVSQNIMNMWSRLWAPSRRNAVWLMSQDIEPQLYQLNLGVGTGGVALYQPPGGLSQTPYATLMGRPLLSSEYSQTIGDEGDLMLIDFSEYQMIEKGSIQSASSIHVAFTTDETCFRFIYRVDGISKWNTPLTPFNGGPTQSPFITLAAR